MDIRNFLDTRGELIDPALCSIDAREEVLRTQRRCAVGICRERRWLRVLRSLRIRGVLVLKRSRGLQAGWVLRKLSDHVALIR